MKKLLLLSFAISMLAFVPHPSRVRASFVNTEAMADKLISLTNQEREARGLRSLAENPRLTQAAYDKAVNMLYLGYFSHSSPNGKAFYRWVDDTGYEYSAVAENLAVNLNMVSAEQMVSSWLNSPGHRANLLSAAYTELGMGVSSGIYQGQEAVFAVHIFAAPKNKTAVPAQIKEPAKFSISNRLVKKIASAEAQPENKVLKNTSVLGESTSTEITSFEMAIVEKKHEIQVGTSTSEKEDATAKDEAYAHKSWLLKILDFFGVF